MPWDIPVAGFSEDLAILKELAHDIAVTESKRSTIPIGSRILTLVHTDPE